MPNTLQAASAQAGRLLESSNLLQLAILAAAVLLGWWIGRRLRPLIARPEPAGERPGPAARSIR